MYISVFSVETISRILVKILNCSNDQFSFQILAESIGRSRRPMLMMRYLLRLKSFIFVFVRVKDVVLVVPSG